MRKTGALFVIVLMCLVSLHATKDRPCGSGDFKLSAEPTKRTFTKQEPVTIRLTFTNLTSRDVHVVPYLFPSDYWVGKHAEGRWRSLATGIAGPNAGQRRGNSSAPSQRSEYKKVRAGESFSTTFEVELDRVTKSPWGEFRVDAVSAHVYESYADSNGCFVVTMRSTSFLVK